MYYKPELVSDMNLFIDEIPLWYTVRLCEHIFLYELFEKYALR